MLWTKIFLFFILLRIVFSNIKQIFAVLQLQDDDDCDASV